MRFFLSLTVVFVIMTVVLGSMLAPGPGSDALAYGISTVPSLLVALLANAALSPERS